MKPLTKSRFTLALKCVTRLYYGNHPTEYADSRSDDAFLKSLAEGGLQAGEMAKFAYHPDPVGGQITVEERGYDDALGETSRHLSSSNGSQAFPHKRRRTRAYLNTH